MDKLELTPVDIRHKEFSTALAGYKKEEVRNFLEMIAAQMEDLQSLAGQMSRERPSLPERVERMDKPEPAKPAREEQKPEDLISRTLILAEQTKEEILFNARKQAENILNAAELQAKKTIEEARHYLNVLEHQYVNLKEQKKQFLMHFRSELEALLARLNQDTILKRENEVALDKRFNELKLDKPGKPELPELGEGRPSDRHDDFSDR
jgi:cell division initiation protein